MEPLLENDEAGADLSGAEFGNSEVETLQKEVHDTTETEELEVAKARRERLPDTRDALTHHFSIAGTEGYITVGLYPDGRPGELFLTIAKEGSTLRGLADTIAVLSSLALQYGVPADALARKFRGTRYEPSGHTTNESIASATSISDYVFTWLGLNFGSDEFRAEYDNAQAVIKDHQDH